MNLKKKKRAQTDIILLAQSVIQALWLIKNYGHDGRKTTSVTAQGGDPSNCITVA